MNNNTTDELRNKIAAAINSVSAENGSNTPDFILAEYLTDCLAAFDKASRARERWYGKELSIVAVPITEPLAELTKENTLLRSVLSELMILAASKLDRWDARWEAALLKASRILRNVPPLDVQP